MKPEPSRNAPGVVVRGDADLTPSQLLKLAARGSRAERREAARALRRLKRQ